MIFFTDTVPVTQPMDSRNNPSTITTKSWTSKLWPHGEIWPSSKTSKSASFARLRSTTYPPISDRGGFNEFGAKTTNSIGPSIITFPSMPKHTLRPWDLPNPPRVSIRAYFTATTESFKVKQVSTERIGTKPSTSAADFFEPDCDSVDQMHKTKFGICTSVKGYPADLIHKEIEENFGPQGNLLLLDPDNKGDDAYDSSDVESLINFRSGGIGDPDDDVAMDTPMCSYTVRISLTNCNLHIKTFVRSFIQIHVFSRHII
jgi:hypothetical protein